MTTVVRGAWTGWSGQTIVELSDGTIWQQAEYHYEYRYAYRPTAAVKSGSMVIQGMKRAVRVRRVNGSRQTIVGAWHGWKGHTILKLTDGTEWEQSEYHYEYHYAYRPEALLIGDLMQVDGMSRPVRVRRRRS